MTALHKLLGRPLHVVALSTAVVFCLLAYSGDMSFASGECETLPQARGKLTQNPADDVAAIDAQIAEIDREMTEKVQLLDTQVAEINRQKVEALKDLTAQLNKLNADRLKLIGKVLEQSAIDAQLQIIQKKIDAVSGPLDGQLKELAMLRQAQLEALKDRRMALVARRESLQPPCPH